jgi:hypothetical protein
LKNNQLPAAFVKLKGISYHRILLKMKLFVNYAIQVKKIQIQRELGHKGQIIDAEKMIKVDNKIQLKCTILF